MIAFFIKESADWWENVSVYTTVLSAVLAVVGLIFSLFEEKKPFLKKISHILSGFAATVALIAALSLARFTTLNRAVRNVENQEIKNSANEARIAVQGLVQAERSLSQTKKDLTKTSKVAENAVTRLGTAEARLNQEEVKTQYVESRERVIRSFKVVVSLSFPTWRSEAVNPIKDSFGMYEHPHQKLQCGDRALPLMMVSQHVIPQGNPNDGSAQHLQVFTYELSRANGIIGSDIKSIANCNRLSISLLMINKIVKVSDDDILKATTPHATIVVNGVSLPFPDVAMTHSKWRRLFADAPGPGLWWFMPKGSSDLATRYLENNINL